MDLGYCPLTYFWIAQYKDGTALSQFDPDTGKENLFRQVDHSKIIRFGWYPFTRSFAKLIFKSEGLIVKPTINPFYEIVLTRDQKLVVKRENTIRYTVMGGVTGRSIVYILGVKDGDLIRIKEDGTLDTKS